MRSKLGQNVLPSCFEESYGERPRQSAARILIFLNLAAEARASHTGPKQQKTRSGGVDWDMPLLDFLPTIPPPRPPCAEAVPRWPCRPHPPPSPHRAEFAPSAPAPSRSPPQVALYLTFEDIAPQSRLNRHWAPPVGAVCGFALALVGDMLL